MILNLILKIRSLQLRLPQGIEIPKGPIPAKKPAEEVQETVPEDDEEYMSEEDLQSAEDEFMNGPAGKAVEPEQDETESDENDQEEPETDEFDSLMEDDEDFGEEDGYEDEDDLLKGWISSMILIMQRQWRFLSEKLRNPNLRKKQKTGFRRRRNGTADRFYAA